MPEPRTEAVLRMLLATTQDPIEAFTAFIALYVPPELNAHLMDDDDNGAEYVRRAIAGRVGVHPDDFEDHQAYAIAVQDEAVALASQPAFNWAIGGEDPERPTHTEREYAIEPSRGGCARVHDTELAGLIDELVDFRDGRLITRKVMYGPWRYVTPEEIRNA